RAEASRDPSPLALCRRGRAGATVFAVSGEARIAFDVATTPLDAADTTGAGDAFDAGFLAAWLATEPGARHRPATLHRSVVAAHRTAARQLARPPKELDL